jgi:flagellar motility protein MotE (MotC chaperone)
MDDEKDIEVVGLDETPPPEPKSSGIKKLLLPFLLGGGVFALGFGVSSILTSEKPVSENPVPAAAQVKEPVADSVPAAHETAMSDSDLAFLEIDTIAIMQELAFLYEPLEKKVDTQVTAGAASGSSDTANWIQRETARIDTARTELEKQQKALEALDNKVNQSLIKLGQAQSARVISLARLYDGMRPDEVAKLFENLDDSLVVAILPRMKPVNAAKLLALLPPKRAAAISTQLITVAGE